MELLNSEHKSWLELDKSITKAKGVNIPFGKYMQDKYVFKDKDLTDEHDTNMAMLIIIKNHVEGIK
jgi:hypothetical protein